MQRSYRNSNCIPIFCSCGRTRSVGADEFAGCEPGSAPDPAHWNYGHHDCVPSAIGARTTNLWRLGGLRAGVAGGANQNTIIEFFGRVLQVQGHQDEAMELFRSNIKKDPNSWIGHNEAARLAVAKGDYDTALKEMKLAANSSPESLKSQHLDLVRRLENKQDIK